VLGCGKTRNIVWKFSQNKGAVRISYDGKKENFCANSIALFMKNTATPLKFKIKYLL